MSRAYGRRYAIKIKIKINFNRKNIYAITPFRFLVENLLLFLL